MIEKRAGFTPGPFHVQLLSESKKLPYAIINDDIDVIARVHDEHDARLIAQAPAMYDMLVKISQGNGYDTLTLAMEARELLAKVDGGDEG
jgi:hypothetical protein